MQDLIGRNIGQYQITERLGRGGMASVYRAVQPSLNRNVAIKVLPPNLAMDPTFLERFRREATSVATLQHPNILPVYDFGQDQDLSYIVMMLVGGGTLRDRIGRIPLTTSVRIASQIADALDHAHSQGIVHRDVKPTNVLMPRDDWALLADFGIARLTEAAGLTSAGTGIGTPEYMSPEQAMGKTADGRADVYSLGILLFEMVTGQLPFSGEPFSIMRQQVQDPVPRASSVNPSVPPALDRIIELATQKDPAQRYGRASQMKEALDGLFQTPPSGTLAFPEPASAVPATVASPTAESGDGGRGVPSDVPPADPGKSAGRNRGLILIGAGAILFGCLSVAGLGAFAYAGPKLLAQASTATPTRAPATPTVRPTTAPAVSTPAIAPTVAPTVAAAPTSTLVPPSGRSVQSLGGTVTNLRFLGYQCGDNSTPSENYVTTISLAATPCVYYAVTISWPTSAPGKTFDFLAVDTWGKQQFEVPKNSILIPGQGGLIWTFYVGMRLSEDDIGPHKAEIFSGNQLLRQGAYTVTK